MKDVIPQSHMREVQSWMQTPPFSHVVALHCRAVPAINVQSSTGITNYALSYTHAHISTQTQTVSFYTALSNVETFTKRLKTFFVASTIPFSLTPIEQLH